VEDLVIEVGKIILQLEYKDKTSGNKNKNRKTCYW
jgi:hypothetical protein